MRIFRFTRFHVAILLALLTGVLMAPSAIKAQDSSSMTGVVTDATDAAVPGATVTLTNKATGQKYTATTNSSGTYHFLNVPPGAGYQETITHPGFSVVEINDIYLAVGDTRTQNAKLSVGATTEVNVTSTSEVTLNTTDATVGSNMDVASLNHLPVQDRTTGVTTLFNLQAGVVNTQLDSTNSTQSGSVTGARTDQTSVTLDGLDVNDIAAGTTFGIISTAPVDSVEQFTGTVGGMNANLGTGSGGQFQLVTKHGTNQFHGNINEYHRDTSTASNTYFNNNVGLPRTPLIRNQFGGNIDGPILRDKLFFFFDFADSRIIQSNAVEPIVPIPALYSSNPTLNYINNGPGCGDTSRLNNQPACISSINAAQAAGFDPSGIGFNPNVLAFLAKRYPAPNDPTQGDGVNTEGLRFTYPQPDFETTYVGRVDYNLTQKNKIYGRFTINRTNEVYPTSTGAPQFPGDPASLTEVDRSYGYVISDIWTIGNNKVNQFYYGDNISKLTFLAGDFTTSPNVYSFTGLANPYGTYNTQSRRIPIPVVRDDFNWQIGSHSLTMGGLFKFIKTNSNNITNFNFVEAGAIGATLGGGLSPGLRPADINQGPNNVALNDYDQIYTDALGAIGEISTNFDYGKTGAAQPPGAGNPYAYRYYQTELYVGDSWRVTKQLTLSYGLRWQTNSVPYEVHGKQSNYQLQGLSQPQSTFNAYMNDRIQMNATGSLNQTLPYFQAVLGGKANNAPSSYKQVYTDFAPRFAFAYNPSFSNKTVFNGSAALVYDRTVINAINNLQSQLSFLFENSATNQLGDLSNPGQRLGANLSYDPGLAPTGTAPPSGFIPFVDPVFGPFGLQQGQEGFDIDPGLKDPYSISLNAGVQQELPWHMVLSINYVGRMGRRLLADADASQILNFPDNASGQTLSQAFAGLTGQLRAGGPLTPQPWIENVVGAAANSPNSAGGPCTSPSWPLILFGPNQTPPPFANCTSLVAATLGQYGPRGDLGDGIPFGLATFGLLPNNVAMPSQFAANGFLTNKGFSNYNGLLVTLTKNVSQGLALNFNYTWSHSIDNNSQAANNNALFNSTGIICDVTVPRACRGNSDFDVRQIITSEAQYDLPFGKNKRFFGSSGVLTNELIGGWSLSGIVSYRTGLPINVLSDAFISSFAAEDPAIFTGSYGDLGFLRSHPNNVQGTVYNFAGGSTGATKALSFFRGPLGLEYGSRNLIHGPSATNLDLGLAKIFPIIPSKNLNLTFRADFFNLFNHPNFSNPGTTVSAPDIVNNVSPFGQILQTLSPSGQVGDIRVGQFSLRLEF
ncbi:MAG TPA: carboxypeptidase-like regulatory domain-containing protein [Acidobacteriaceae bacterium]|nr:carboxypeptidase-like regulatory domain-containing protein [Acidobacteriaceae bacterium]